MYVFHRVENDALWVLLELDLDKYRQYITFIASGMNFASVCRFQNTEFEFMDIGHLYHGAQISRRSTPQYAGEVKIDSRMERRFLLLNIEQI
jgi:hypothetical protein